MITRLLIALGIVSAAVFGVGCSPKSDTPGDAVEDAADDMGDAVEDAGDAVEDAAE